mgnify:CR=1 FL=1
MGKVTAQDTSTENADKRAVTGTEYLTQDKRAMDCHILGGAGLSPQGLNVGGKVTVVSINSTTWTALPASPLANRNALTIQNASVSEIKLNYDNTTVGYVGIKVIVGSERYYDIKDTIIIYAKSQAGTVDIVVEELA